MLKRLKAKLFGWLLTRAVLYAGQELESQHIGQLLNTAMDKQWGAEKVKPIQVQMARWLRHVATELEV